jgi:hypothetical protein
MIEMRYIATAVAALALVSPAVLAQDASAPVVLPEITVTGERPGSLVAPAARSTAACGCAGNGKAIHPE